MAITGTWMVDMTLVQGQRQTDSKHRNRDRVTHWERESNQWMQHWELIYIICLGLSPFVCLSACLYWPTMKCFQCSWCNLNAHVLILLHYRSLSPLVVRETRLEHEVVG